MKSVIQNIKRVLLTPFYWWFFTAAALFIAAVELVRLAYGFPTRVDLFGYDGVASISLLLFFVTLFSGHLLYVVLWLRPLSPFRKLAEDYKAFFTVERFSQAMVLFVVYIPFFASFTYFKTMIPKIIPFRYDALFSRWDAFIHFGYQPWEILQPLVGYAAVTLFIGVAYKLWFVVKFFVMYWQAFSLRYPALRAQFFLTLLGSWIINGAIFALFLSSAGPCFYDYFVHGQTGSDPYAPLMTYLHAVNEQHNIANLDTQAYLLEIYKGGHPQMFSGISAMPSLHVSIAFLIVLLCWPRKILRIFALFFLALTYVGSIHLGWHYAVDGYFAIVTTYFIWRGAGYLVRRFDLEKPRRQRKTYEID